MPFLAPHCHAFRPRFLPRLGALHRKRKAIMANERQILEELSKLRSRNEYFKAKRDRGERFSAAEQREIMESAQRASELVIEAREAREAREASNSAARLMGGVPSFGSDDDSESRAFTNYLRSGVRGPELRAAGEASGSAGGFLVPPGWWQRLQIAVKAYGGTSNDFEVVETDTGNPLQWATNDPTGVIGSLIGENTQISDQDYVFGQATAGAYAYTTGVMKVSLQLAQDSAFDIDAFVLARAAEALGRAQAQVAISGTGSAQPLGIITALNAATGLTSGGVYTLGTGNKVNVIASGSSITADTAQVTELTAGALNPNSLIGVIKSVDPAYRAQGAKWYMNDGTFQSHKMVADAYGQPLYKGLWDDSAPTLMGYPVTVDNNIPALTASTASGLLFGHAQSAMMIRRVANSATVDRVPVGSGNLLKLDQRYMDFLQIGYIGYTRFDIRSNDLRAMTVVKAAAS